MNDEQDDNVQMVPKPKGYAAVNEAFADARKQNGLLREIVKERADAARAGPNWEEVGPALLAACEAMVHAWGDETWGTVYAMERALPACRAAIARAALTAAKATGAPSTDTYAQDAEAEKADMVARFSE